MLAAKSVVCPLQSLRVTESSLSYKGLQHALIVHFQISSSSYNFHFFFLTFPSSSSSSFLKIHIYVKIFATSMLKMDALIHPLQNKGRIEDMLKEMQIHADICMYIYKYLVEIVYK